MMPMAGNRVESTFTSISWIPSEAIQGFMRLPMDVGLGRYDDAPPDHVANIDEYVAEGKCRFANQLHVWADIEDGHIVDSGSSGGGILAATKVKPGLAVPAIGFPELRSVERDGDRSITFVQTAGGRTGAPFPRKVGASKKFKMKSPTAWTTLAITIGADGHVACEARGSSPFPRHWFYDTNGDLIGKSATIDFENWVAREHDIDTPWGDRDSEVRVAARVSAIERALSNMIMDGKQPNIREFDAGTILMKQGDHAGSMELLLDGLVEIEVDGEVVAESGPGSVLGERAFLEDGLRTATIRAVTKVKTAEADPESIGDANLRRLRTAHMLDTPT